MSTPQVESHTQSASRSDMMRRLQIGIAGLFAVLLLVGLAGLIGDRARKQADASATGTVAPPTIKAPGGEPLVELGVQPAATPDQPVKSPQTQTQRQAQPLPPGTTVPDLQPDPVLERARQAKK